MTDPIADMLTQIRNALMVRHDSISLPSSKIKVAIAKILKEEGYIEGYEVIANDLQPTLSGLKRVSKPGRRIYKPVESIPWVRSGLGIAILSTPKGVITGQQARRLNVGGEIICYVW